MELFMSAIVVMSFFAIGLWAIVGIIKTIAELFSHISKP